MLSNSRGLVRQFLFLIILAAALGVVYTRWWPTHNLVRWGGELEAAVNKQLVDAGLHDSLILSQVNHEHSPWGISWVETERQIKAQSPALLFELSGRLTPVAHRFYCLLSRHTVDDSTIFDIGLGPVRFQRLIFVKGTPVVSMPIVVAPVEKTTSSATAQVAFVIDDVATVSSPMDHFASLGIPLTFAILPRDRHCGELAEKAEHMNFGVILHLPMEPIDLAHNNPGSAGLYLKMSTEELHQQFNKDVASIPHLQGINNHMGSAFTQNEEKMQTVMPWVKEKGLFFLDSKTTPKSVVCQVAKRFGVPCRVNETFLDNSDDVSAIEKQLDQVMTLALRHHRTIAIGHYRRKHLIEALTNKLPEFRAKGIQLVTLPTFYQ